MFMLRRTASFVVLVGWLAFADSVQAQRLFRRFCPPAPCLPVPFLPVPCPPVAGAPIVCMPALVMPYADQVSFWPRLAEGMVFYSTDESTTEQDMKVMGQNIVQKQVQTFVTRWQVRGKKSDGNWRLEGRFVAIKLHIEIGGNVIEFDSSSPAGSPSTGFDFFRQLLKADLRYHVRPDGAVAAVLGIDSFLENIGGESPGMKPLLKTILSETTMARSAQQILSLCPRPFVKAGESWQLAEDLDLGPIGRYRKDSTLTYSGRAGDRDKLVATTSLKYMPPTKTDSGLPFTIKAASFDSSQGSGELYFDVARGRLASATWRIDMAGTITIEVGGMDTTVAITQRQTQRLSVTDQQPTLGK